jgi:Uma2 family endonuclease
MATLTVPIPVPSPVRAEESLPLFQLSIEKYHDMVAAGILTADDKVELIEGVLVQKVPKHPPHVFAAAETTERLTAMLPGGHFVSKNDPATIGNSEPEPDVQVIRGVRSDYLSRHLKPADLLLAVEVADSSLRYDRVVKQRLYARAGIAIYWIINLVDRQIEVHTNPDASTAEPLYKTIRIFTAADRVPVTIAGQVVGEIAVADVLP